jgi:outer membrane protein assembly factor BamB
MAAGGPRTPPEIVSFEGRSLVLFSGEGRLTALRSGDGEVEWTTKLDPRRELDCKELVLDNAKIFGSHLHKAVAWDLESGEKAWEFTPLSKSSHEGEFFSLGYYGLGPNNFWGSGRDGRVFGVDRKSGQLAREWRYQHRTTALTFQNDALYTARHWVPEGAEGQAKGGLVKLDAASGDSVWAYQTGRGGFFTMRPLVQDGRVYAGTNQGANTVFVALNAETGEVIWRNEDVRVYWAIWTDTTNGPRIFVNDGRNLIALDPTDGKILWRTNLQAGHGEAGLAYLDGYLYHPHGRGLRVLNAETGEIVHVEWPENGYFWEVGTGAGKVFAQDSGALYAFEPYSPE